MRIEYLLYVYRLQKWLHGRYSREHIPKLAIVLFSASPRLSGSGAEKQINLLQILKKQPHFPLHIRHSLSVLKISHGQTIYGFVKVEKKRHHACKLGTLSSVNY